MILCILDKRIVYKNRFVISLQLLSQPPLNGQCGTLALGWLKGSQPAREDGPVEREVCYVQNDDRCVTRSRIQVRRCYGHYVYKFKKTFFPFKARYCAEDDPAGIDCGRNKCSRLSYNSRRFSVRFGSICCLCFVWERGIWLMELWGFVRERGIWLMKGFVWERVIWWSYEGEIWLSEVIKRLFEKEEFDSWSYEG